jgi:hypothetical protein
VRKVCSVCACGAEAEEPVGLTTPFGGISEEVASGKFLRKITKLASDLFEG